MNCSYWNGLNIRQPKTLTAIAQRLFKIKKEHEIHVSLFESKHAHQSFTGTSILLIKNNLKINTVTLEQQSCRIKTNLGCLMPPLHFMCLL